MHLYIIHVVTMIVHLPFEQVNPRETLVVQPVLGKPRYKDCSIDTFYCHDLKSKGDRSTGTSNTKNKTRCDGLTYCLRPSQAPDNLHIRK